MKMSKNAENVRIIQFQQKCLINNVSLGAS